MPASPAYSILLKKENAHDDAIYCCAWGKTNTCEDPKAPLKDFIVTGGLDGLVKVWLLENNRLELVHTLSDHSMAVQSVAISPDGHTFASTSLDSTLIIWDLLSGQKVHEIQSLDNDVWKVEFSPGGTHLLTGSHTGKLRIYGIEKATLDNVLDTRGKFVLCVAWSADGQYIASGSTDGVVSVFDAMHDKLLHTIQAHTQAVNSIVFSPNSKLIVTASSDGRVHTYNVTQARIQSSIKLQCRATSVAVSRDGTRAAVAAADGTVRVALVDKLEDLHVFKEHTGPTCSVQFNAEGNKLLSVSKDKSINIYECPLPPKQAAKK